MSLHQSGGDVSQRGGVYVAVTNWFAGKRPAKDLQQQTLLTNDSLDPELQLKSTQHKAVKIYPIRWYIVAVYSLFACMQGMTYSIPGVIANQMQAFYSFDSNTTQLLILYGPIFFVVFAIPFGWHMDRYGARTSVVIGTSLVFLASIIRCFATDSNKLSIALLHISYVMNGIAGPVAMAAVGKISESWFPPEQRTTATAIMAESNLFGSCIVFPVATYLVQSPDNNQLLHLDAFCIAAAGLACLCAWIYFPSHAPTPPSASAASQKHSEQHLTPKKLIQALVKLARDRNFLVLALCYGAVNGMASVFGALLAVDVETLHISQTTAGWLGFANSLGGTIGGVFCARYADKLRNHKTLLVASLGAAGVSTAVFAMLVQKLFLADTTGGLVLMFIFVAFSGYFCDSAVPLFFDLSLECTFPLPEGTVIMLLTVLNNIAAFPPLLIPSDNYGVTWINWAFTGVFVVAAVCVGLFYTGKSSRFTYDMTHEVEDEDSARQLLLLEPSLN